MTKIIHSLQTKLIASFILLIVVIAGGTFLFTLGQTKKALLDSTRDDMLQIVGMVSKQFSVQEIDAISQFKAGQDTSAEFLAIKKKMQDMRSLSPNIVNLYVMRVEGENVFLIVDDLEEDPAVINQEYEEPENRLFEAIDGPKVSDNVYSDEWGTFLSGYAPLKNAAGQTVLLIGADMQATKVIERQNFIGNTIYYIMAIGILIAAILIGIFSVTIIRDINKLNKTADEISKGNTNVNVDVKRSDEIGELADSFGRMVASLKIMMASDTVEEKSPEEEKNKPSKKSRV